MSIFWEISSSLSRKKCWQTPLYCSCDDLCQFFWWISFSLSLSTRRKCLEWIIMNRYISRLFLLRRKLRSVIFSALSFHWEWMLRMNYNRKLTLEKLDPLSIFSLRKENAGTSQFFQEISYSFLTKKNADWHSSIVVHYQHLFFVRKKEDVTRKNKYVSSFFFSLRQRAQNEQQKKDIFEWKFTRLRIFSQRK